MARTAYMASWIGVVLAGMLVSRPARADHHGMAMAPETTESSFSAGLALGAASYDTRFYGGNYQSVTPSLAWFYDRIAVSASVSLYRLEENGLSLYGPGDAIVVGQVRVIDGGTVHAGAALGLSAPTATDQNGFGMGHPMAMPSIWATAVVGRVMLSGSLGYSRALATLGDHVHGMWPLVEPMNMSEITWGASAAVPISHGVHVTARVFGGDPIIAPGIDRVIGAVRVGWGSGRVSSAAEVQAGVVGDPFTVRAVLDTALRF